MIRIGEYGIAADNSGFVVGKITRRIDKKTGIKVESLSGPRYFSNLQGCLRELRKKGHLEAIEAYDGDLAGAVVVLDEANMKFERLIEGVEKE